MGNSGSIHNIASEIDDLTPYVQHEAHLVDHRPLKWTQSYPRENHQQQLYQQQQQQHIKVLPDLNEGPRLRFTANGAILQSGGTISGRKDPTAPPPLLQRARTSIHYDLSHKNNSETFNRSKHKLSLMQDRQHQDTSYKRFGSEPDLRVNEDEENNGVNQTKISKSKMVKNKKKKAAPPPPQDFTPLSSTEHQNNTANNSHQKKLRLFKTKAESRKTSMQAKLATEASDLHFKRSTLGAIGHRTAAEPVRRSTQYSPPTLNDSKKNSPLDSNWQESKVKVLPVAAFRREKSFDVSLLASHHKLATEEAIKSSRERQRISANLVRKPIPPERRLVTRQVSAEPERPIRKSAVETKLAMRKYSQPVQLTSTDFKKELEEATKRRSLIVEVMEKEFPVIRDQENDLKSLGQSVPKVRTITSRPRVESQQKDQNLFNSEKPIVTLAAQEAKKRPESKIPQLTKTFYFGMEGKKEASNKKESENFGKIQMKVIDEFAKNIMTNQRKKRAGSESSESALSSEEGYPITGVTGGYEENTNGGIHVHVRPTLPRRQLEIPRFSPAAAWRMLNDEQKEANNFFGRSTNQFTSELVESKQPLEERIQRIYREPNPLYSDNKSGDSGISGDAGLPERTESPRQNFVSVLEAERTAAKVGPFLKPWIPQQDLEEETSSDGEVTKVNDANQFSSRGHVFSLSLPREGHLSAYEEKEKPGFSSLQKLKKTVSNAFFNTSDRITSYRSDNWLLSRSAPNSIENNTQVSPTIGNQPNQQTMVDNDTLDHRQLTIQPSPFSYFTGGKHVMYLPNHPIGESSDYQNLERVDGDLPRSNSSDADSFEKPCRERKYSSNNNKSSHLGTKERESLQDLTLKMNDEQNLSKANSSKNRGHRFTFQSTVRQIERRRIAEKLSKEAEEKEAQRLSELEAMRKVEEEFQRKRAREKASIRHQLRLFSLEENQCTSLPMDWQLVGSQNQRAEPDGAVSSATPSPTSRDGKTKAFYHEHEQLGQQNSSGIKSHQQVQVPGTEILSEFRTMRREYLEYRSDRNKSDFRQDQQTEHPPVVCNIPYSRSGKEANIYGYDEDYGANCNSILLDNYRRDFARGRSICSSDSELSTPSGEGAVERRPRYRCRSPSPSL